MNREQDQQYYLLFACDPVSQTILLEKQSEEKRRIRPPLQDSEISRRGVGRPASIANFCSA